MHASFFSETVYEPVISLCLSVPPAAETFLVLLAVDFWTGDGNSPASDISH